MYDSLILETSSSLFSFERKSSCFKKIHVELHVEGDIPADRIIRAAHLSFDKYCSVSKNLEKTSEIVHSIVLNGEKIKIA